MYRAALDELVAPVTIMSLNETSEFQLIHSGTLKVDVPVIAARDPKDPFHPPLSVRA
jgi:hypothetical protein